MARMSSGSGWLRQRNSRSFRQCPSLLTMITVGTRSCVECRPQRICKVAASAVKRSRSRSPTPAEAQSNRMRMKNRPVLWSLNCAASVMFAPCSASTPVTAWTMPARSGQDRVRMKASGTVSLQQGPALSTAQAHAAAASGGFKPGDGTCRPQAYAEISKRISDRSASPAAATECLRGAWSERISSEEYRHGNGKEKSGSGGVLHRVR